MSESLPSAGAGRGRACLVDSSGTIVWVDNGWQQSIAAVDGFDRRLGVGADYLEVARVAAAANAPGAAQFAQMLLDVLQGRRAHGEHAYDCPSPDGVDRRLVAHIERIQLDGRRCAFVLHEDRTPEWLAAQALASSEQRYRDLFDAAPEAVFVLAVDEPEAGRILDANAAAARMHGYDLDELIGRNIGELDVPEDAALVAERIRRLTTAGSITFTATHVRRDGSTFPVEVSARRATVGGRACLVSFDRDVSERHRVQGLLHENQVRLHLAARAGRVGFWDWDLRTNRVYFSAEWKQQLGYEPSELADEFAEWESRVHPDDLPGAMAMVHDHLAGRRDTYYTEFRMRHRDGSYRWIYVRGEALRDGAGEPYRFVGCHIDVTARKQAEQQRAELDRRVGQLVRLESIGTLAAGIAHDFNNILSIITGNVELALLDDQSSLGVRDSLHEIRKASQRARSLVRQVLTFRHGGGGERGACDPAAIVAEAVELLRATTPRSLTIDCDVDDAVPQVSGDAEQLQQVLVNLGTNAWHAIGDRPGTIHFAARADRDGVLIECRDDGHGMDEATRQRVFEPFFTTKGPGSGTGLGLSVVHGIVTAHGGTVDVESAPGIGTTFRIWLPAAVAVPARSTPPSAAHVAAAKVLLLDDEPRLRSVLQRGLERLGHEVRGCATPGDALELLRAGVPVDVLITDYDMPGMRGDAFARRVRELRPGLPILMCSGYLTEAAELQVRDAGVARVMIKPIVAGELHDAVAELVAPHVSSAAEAGGNA